MFHIQNSKYVLPSHGIYILIILFDKPSRNILLVFINPSFQSHGCFGSRTFSNTVWLASQKLLSVQTLSFTVAK